jgi:hypothetical protein
MFDHSQLTQMLRQAWEKNARLRAENELLSGRLQMASDGAYLFLKGTGMLAQAPAVA